MKKILCRSWSSLRVALALSVLTLAGCAKSNEEVSAEVAKECQGPITVTVAFNVLSRSYTMTCEMKAETFTK